MMIDKSFSENQWTMISGNQWSGKGRLQKGQWSYGCRGSSHPESQSHWGSLQGWRQKKQLRLQSSKPSISSWLQRRRQSVKEKSLSQNKEKTADLVEEHEPLRKKAKRAAGSSWTDKHEKHENKLRDLATSRRFEAQRSGHLVEGEKKISSNKYQEMEEKQFANDKATKRKNAMVSQVLGVTQPNLI